MILKKFSRYFRAFICCVSIVEDQHQSEMAVDVTKNPEKVSQIIDIGSKLRRMGAELDSKYEQKNGQHSYLFALLLR